VLAAKTSSPIILNGKIPLSDTEDFLQKKMTQHQYKNYRIK